MNELRKEILILETELTEKKKQLFLKRLEKIAGCSFTEGNILNLNISTNLEENTWQISYIHHTDKYDVNDYIYAVGTDSEIETPDVVNVFEPVSKKTKIIFGKMAKYYIKGGIPLNVYRNTTGEIRITNPDYEFDLDLDEQRNLVQSYSENYTLPEWFAIALLLYMSDNKWDDDALITHLSFV